MIRVFDFQIEGMAEPVKIGTLSFRNAELDQEKAKEMLAQKDELPPSAWLDRRMQFLCDALNRGGVKEWTLDEVKDFDPATHEAMWQFVMMKSGLKVAEVAEGEAKAA